MPFKSLAVSGDVYLSAAESVVLPTFSLLAASRTPKAWVHRHVRAVCPQVRGMTTGRPSPLHLGWILVEKPPRVRPRASSPTPAFFGAGGVLVGADDGAVDRLDAVLANALSFSTQARRGWIRPLPDGPLAKVFSRVAAEEGEEQ
jgi:hypothetical protein